MIKIMFSQRIDSIRIRIRIPQRPIAAAVIVTREKMRNQRCFNFNHIHNFTFTEVHFTAWPVPVEKQTQSMASPGFGAGRGTKQFTLGQLSLPSFLGKSSTGLYGWG